MSEWKSYVTCIGDRPHTVIGDLRIYPQLHSPQLNNHRDILVWLPPSYGASDRRYPVLYLQDGQNLFDRYTSFVGEWELDEHMTRLAESGLEAILVGIPNMGMARLNEYGPFRDPRGGGLGDAYLEFLVYTVKPLIDQSFRTSTERADTGIMGSSMGGLIALYAGFKRPETFGFVGAMSPSLWFAQGQIFDVIQRTPHTPGCIYADMGGLEGRVPTGWWQKVLQKLRREGPLNDLKRLRRALQKRGYRHGKTLLCVGEPNAQHHEPAWSRRFPGALKFFLAHTHATLPARTR